MDLLPAALCKSPRKLAMLSLHPFPAQALLGTMRMCLARSQPFSNFFFCSKTCGEQNAFCFGKQVILDQILPKDGRVLHQVLSHLTVPVIR